MESIITIDLKSNPDVLDDFEGMEVGEKVKVVVEASISELSENRAALPLENVISISAIGNADKDEDEEDEEQE
jgi:hypothetical protein